MHPGRTRGRGRARARLALRLSLALLPLVLVDPSSLHAERPRVYAITGARIIVAPGKVIDKGTLVLRDGLIEAVGAEVKAPPDAAVIDGQGRTLHAGFIDACSDVGLRKAEGAPGGGGAPSGGGAPRPAGPPTPPPGAAHPLSRVHPERRVLDQIAPADRDLERHRSAGFTAALIVPQEGILRGTSALITLGDRPVGESVVREDVAQHVAFERGSFGAGYPSSLMGAIAAVRQGLEDAKRHEVWQARYEADPQGMKRPDLLSAYAPLSQAAAGKIPVVFDVDTPSNVLRALEISKEYGLNAIVVGSGADDEVLDAIKASGRPVIVAMGFPDKPEVDDADEALETDTPTLRRYLGARENPGRLAAAGVPIALGTCRLKNVSDFPSNLRKAIDSGLKPDAALAALTTTPAKLFGVDREMGTLEAGRAADVVMLDGDLFGERTKVVRVFVDGIEYKVEEKRTKADPNAKVDPRGTWSVSLDIAGRSVSRTWTIGGSEGNWSGTAETREGTVSFTSVTLLGNEMTVRLPSPRGGGDQEIVVVITGDSFEGSGEFPGGASFSVKGTRSAGAPRGAEVAGASPEGSAAASSAAAAGGEDDRPYSCTHDGGDL